MSPQISRILLLFSMVCSACVGGTKMIPSTQPELLIEVVNPAAVSPVKQGHVVLLQAKAKASSFPIEQAKVTWYADQKVICQNQPKATGEVDCEVVFSKAGEKNITLDILGQENQKSTAQLQLNIQAAEVLRGQIKQPANQQVHYNNVALDLVAEVGDPKQKKRTLVVRWKSDVAGVLQDTKQSTEKVSYAANLAPGRHYLQLIVEDGAGRRTTDARWVEVKDGNDPTTVKLREAMAAKLSKLEFSHALKHFYAGFGGNPVFLDGLQGNNTAKKMYEILQDADSHGIDRTLFKVGLRAEGKTDKAMTFGPFPSVAEAADWELKLANALMRYVYEFQIVQRVNADKRMKAKFKKTKAKKIARVAIDVVPEFEMSKVWPSSEQYGKLRKMLSAYKKTNASKPLSWKAWVAIHKALRSKPEAAELLSKKQLMVKNIQQRLQLEGYYKGAINGQVDEATQQAIKRYHTNHSLKYKDGVSKKMLAVLMQPIKKRIALTKLNLQRLRESVVDRSNLSTYIRVNVAAYRLDLWENNKRTRQHKVIVGSNKLDFDRNSWIQGYLNRTPMIESRMLFVVVNPTWRPPPRILDEEFGGKEDVVVFPGPRNPLGYAKFILDKTNAVFLHDTNNRRLFGRTHRAMSHGCMRVHKATELSEYLALNYTKTTAEKFKKYSSGRREVKLPVTKELPVYAEYVSMELNDQEEVVFFDDPYRYDKSFMKGKRPRRKIRYGSASMRPKAVPFIPTADFKRIRKELPKAPDAWPPKPIEEAATPTPEAAPKPVTP